MFVSNEMLFTSISKAIKKKPIHFMQTIGLNV